MTWALLPLKSFESAKQRLSGVLTPAERQQLFQTMVEDVLAVLTAHPALDQIWVVSDDADAQRLATQYGAQWLAESALPNARGLNGVVTQASRWLEARGAQRLMIVHGDLPMISSEDIDALLTCSVELGSPSLVLATDRAADGSNVLLVTPPSLLPFHYGEGSRAKHVAAATEVGIACEIVQRPGLACDIDSVDDLLVLLQASSSECAVKTSAYLAQSGIAARLTQGEGMAVGRPVKR